MGAVVGILLVVLVKVVGEVVLVELEEVWIVSIVPVVFVE